MYYTIYMFSSCIVVCSDVETVQWVVQCRSWGVHYIFCSRNNILQGVKEIRLTAAPVSVRVPDGLTALSPEEGAHDWIGLQRRE